MMARGDSQATYLEKRAALDRELAVVEGRIGFLVRSAESGVREALSLRRFARHKPGWAFMGALAAGYAVSRLLGKEASGRVIRNTAGAIAGRVVSRFAMRWVNQHVDAWLDSFLSRRTP